MASRARSALQKLYVGNIPWTVSKRELQDYFAKFGYVRTSTVLFNKETGMSRGFGFVEFSQRQSIDAVLSQSSHVLEGNKLIVSNNTYGNQMPSQARRDFMKATDDTNVLT
ncbi:SRA stem-loop-interacting RNA-binding protein, mitochondrial-like [Lineus longissimus]|uniref:SRA stem-loop-interacting RNA-binding protein, mitochondrial-like n=1 Tax=Lineus longissimus TaxID=88925 RepID=UPI002B4DB745